MSIKFGTDGWRGVIADDFTYANVRRAAGAIAHYVLQNEEAQRGVLVGYDTRFGSPRFAQVVAETLAAAGIPVSLSDDYTPTPALSYAVKHRGAAGAVMVTSSHNPWMWNGIKYKASYGGSATPEIIGQIEARLDEEPPQSQRAAAITPADFKPEYVEAISKFADLDAIAGSDFKFAIDCMYGSGRNVLAGIFDSRGVEYLQIRSEVNPLFPGINPEPIEPHIQALEETVVREGCQAGLCTDGDADRIAAVTEDGALVDAHKCYAVLLKWLLEYKKWPGAITRAYNTTSMLDRMAKKYGRELIEHGIGFKYVCDVVLSGKEVLIGGEESGGIGIPRHLPERDGILNSLLIANAMADQKKTLGQLVADLQQEFGAHYYGRRDLHIDNELKQSAIRRAQTVESIGPFRVARRGDLDGIKLFLDAPRGDHGSEAWVLVRASGTEPLLRIYSEAAAPELVQQILESAVALVHQPATVAG